MKIYTLYRSYYDGDHDHGAYESPPFATRELAEAFRALIVEKMDSEDHREQNEFGWWTSSDYIDETGNHFIQIIEQEILGELPELESHKKYLSITYT